VSNLNDVETVETVEGAEATRNDYEERRALDSWTSSSGVDGGQPNPSRYLRSRFSVPFIPDANISRSLFGIIESKKSAERRNMISDENRGWSDSPKHQES
jgi:hypothetical protein